jgi:glycosyltransferase involved in cell wall biosynthesis
MNSGFAATIVIPLLNQVDEWLEQCVRSALAQSTRCEVLVVTSPRTRRPNREVLSALVSEFDNLRLVQRQTRGFAVALNTGFAAASAERIGLLLSDDWLDEGAVETCLQEDADVVSTGNSVFAADGHTYFPKVSWRPKAERFRSRQTMELKARYLQHFFLFRKSRLLEIGGADETLGDFPGIDDFDMIWVLLEHGATVAVVEKSLYNYRDHDGERLSLRPAEEAIQGLERILKKHGIVGAEKDEIMRTHARWFGQPLHRVHAGLEKAREPS